MTQMFSKHMPNCHASASMSSAFKRLSRSLCKSLCIFKHKTWSSSLATCACNRGFFFFFCFWLADTLRRWQRQTWQNFNMKSCRTKLISCQQQGETLMRCDQRMRKAHVVPSLISSKEYGALTMLMCTRGSSCFQYGLIICVKRMLENIFVLNI